MAILSLLAAILTSAGANGARLTIESASARVDPARSLFLTVTLQTLPGAQGELPDLRERVVGFSLAEDFLEAPRANPDGSTTRVAKWRLVPEPAAETYKIRPFAVGELLVGATYFEPPAARESVTGEMEIDPTRDFPPLSWKLVGWGTLLLAGVVALAAGLFALLRYLLRRLKEHRMSPIERAWVELDRLLKRGLPGRGYYKDFYVELTLIVRRYIQRKYGIKAPHLTTEEFLSSLSNLSNFSNVSNISNLSNFLSSADLIKFAGVEASPEMADEATASARTYLTTDAS